MSVTIQDIAARAGVSGTTVSLTFKPGKTRVSDATRQRVLEVARQLNYVPNLSARNLRVGQQPTIGFLIADITNPFYSRMVQVVEDTARELGFQLLIAESRWDADNENRAISHMIQSRVQGIIGTFSEKTRVGLGMIGSRGLPHIAVDTCPPGYKGAYIQNDMQQAGEISAVHLWKCKYRKPVLMMPSDGARQTFSAFASLSRGVQAGLDSVKAKLSITDRTVHSELSLAGGRVAFQAMREKFPDADSVICASDLCALGVLDELHGLKIVPGKEFGVLGIDDLDVSAMRQISLTTIREPYEQMASEAARALITAVQTGEAVKMRSQMKVKLIARNSTNRLNT